MPSVRAASAAVTPPAAFMGVGRGPAVEVEARVAALFELEERHDPLECLELRLRHHAPLEHPRAQPPSQNGRAVQEADGVDREAGLGDFGVQLVLRIAPEVVQVLVERPVERPHRRHEQHQMAAGGERSGEILQRRAIVLDVLEHVEAHNRVDLAGHQVAVIAIAQRERVRCDPHVVAIAEPAEQFAQIVRFDVGRDHELRLSTK